MAKCLQFIAEHQIIIWFVIGSGVICLLQSTVFYTASTRSVRRMLKSSLAEKALEQQPFWKPVFALAESMNGAKWTRVVGVFQGVAFILTGFIALLVL